MIGAPITFPSTSEDLCDVGPEPTRKYLAKHCTTAENDDPLTCVFVESINHQRDSSWLCSHCTS